MAQNQKSYDNEFKAQAVKLAQEIIDSGKAYDKMVEFAKATKQFTIYN